ncbi:MAG: hypothetical protein NUW37_01665 [Planctomycetes bacterium]|nr:hypothetical protein [Planctomycetota bacterium]
MKIIANKIPACIFAALVFASILVVCSPADAMLSSDDINLQGSSGEDYDPWLDPNYRRRSWNFSISIHGLMGFIGKNDIGATDRTDTEAPDYRDFFGTGTGEGIEARAHIRPWFSLSLGVSHQIYRGQDANYHATSFTDSTGQVIGAIYSDGSPYPVIWDSLRITLPMVGARFYPTLFGYRERRMYPDDGIFPWVGVRGGVAYISALDARVQQTPKNIGGTNELPALPYDYEIHYFEKQRSPVVYPSFGLEYKEKKFGVMVEAGYFMALKDPPGLQGKASDNAKPPTSIIVEISASYTF